MLALLKVQFEWAYNENKEAGWQRVPWSAISDIFTTSLCSEIEIVNCLVLLAVQTQVSLEEEAFRG